MCDQSEGETRFGAPTASERTVEGESCDLTLVSEDGQGLGVVVGALPWAISIAGKVSHLKGS